MDAPDSSCFPNVAPRASRSCFPRDRSSTSPRREKDNWRRGRDSNPRYPFEHAGFQDRCHKPLGHPSARVDQHSLLPQMQASERSQRALPAMADNVHLALCAPVDKALAQNGQPALSKSPEQRVGLALRGARTVCSVGRCGPRYSAACALGPSTTRVAKLAGATISSTSKSLEHAISRCAMPGRWLTQSPLLMVRTP